MGDSTTYSYQPNQPAFDPSAYSTQLDFYKKYDPNASVTGSWTDPVYSGGDSPTQTSAGYWTPQFNYDQSLVPKIGGDAFTEDDRQYLLPMDEMGTGRNLANYKLYNPNLVYNDPVYGRVTDIRNVNQSDGFDWLGTLGPMAVGGVAGLLAGPAAAGMVQLGMGGFNVAKGLAEGQSWQRVLANAALSAGSSYLGSQIGGALNGSMPTIDTPLGSINPASVVGGAASGLARNLGGQLITSNTPGPNVGPSAKEIYNTIDKTPFIAGPAGAAAAGVINNGGNMPNPTYPDGGVQYDPTTGMPYNTPSGGFNPLDIAGNVINYVTGNHGDPFSVGSAAGSAALNYMNQRDYQNVLDKYVPEMNPFGSQRDYYQGMLKNAYAHPDQVLADPAHQAVVDKQSAALMSKMRAGGYMGSGLQATSLADYVTQSDAQYLDQYRHELANLAGANIGPSAAAGLIGTATKGIMDSRSNMFADLTRAINPNSSNPTGRYTGGLPTGGVDPSGAVGQLVKNGGGYIQQAVGGIPAGSFVTSAGTVLAPSGQQIGTYINGKYVQGFATDNPNPGFETGYPDDPNNPDNMNGYPINDPTFPIGDNTFDLGGGTGPTDFPFPDNTFDLGAGTDFLWD